MAQKASDSQEKSLFPKFLLSSFSLLLLSLPDPHTSEAGRGGERVPYRQFWGLIGIKPNCLS